MRPLLTQTGLFKVRYQQNQRRIIVENNSRKTAALFIVLSVFFLAMFDWEWPSFSNFKFNSAYTLGITWGMFFIMFDRYLKHATNSDFQWKKLLKSHLIAFLLFCPISIVLIMPKLNRPRNVWRSDYSFAFLLTYFLITVGPKIPTMYERLDSILTSKNGKKKE